MLVFIFWMSSFLIIYHYFLYPAFIISYARIAGRFNKYEGVADSNLPTVTFIIAAYNEESVIEAKIKNTLEIDYPEEKLQIIIVSDGSDDDTASIVQNYSAVLLGMHNDERMGKSAAINRAVEQATGEILVFSDANNDFNARSIRYMVQHYEAPETGGVCGLKQIKEAQDRESSQGDSLYWRYESAIKNAESDLGSITGADGEIFSMRKSLFKPLDTTMINDDAELTFSIVQQDLRVLYETRAESTEYASFNIEDDFNVKVRMVSGGFQTIQKYRSFIFSFGWFQFTFFSHKVLRWLIPHFMILAFISNLVLIGHSFFYTILMAGQLAFYLIGYLAWKAIKREELAGFRYIIFYFCAMNLAAFKGFIRYVRGNQSVNWVKAKR